MSFDHDRIDAQPRANHLPCGTNATLEQPISKDGTPEKGVRYAVPARCGRAVRVNAGETIRIINTHGTQVCDTWAFKADNVDEFISMEHARPGIDRLIPRVGDALMSNRRRPLMTMTADSSPGIHDTLMAACDLYRYINLGVRDYHDNCADNLRMAMQAIGAPVGEVPQPFNVWMNIPVQPDMSVRWEAPVAGAGDYVDLRAEMDCIVAMSACPQDMIPINGEACTPVELHFEVHSR
ncbi:MAG: urea carboxylase-associated family protein [Ectothiorhodospiraceae bacterium]